MCFFLIFFFKLTKLLGYSFEYAIFICILDFYNYEIQIDKQKSLLYGVQKYYKNIVILQKKNILKDSIAKVLHESCLKSESNFWEVLNLV